MHVTPVGLARFLRARPATCRSPSALVPEIHHEFQLRLRAIHSLQRHSLLRHETILQLTYHKVETTADFRSTSPQSNAMTQFSFLDKDGIAANDTSASTLEDTSLATEASNADVVPSDGPPDGGYGWVCCAAVSIINCFTWGIAAVRSMT